MGTVTAEDIRGVIGILPTPARPGADRWDAADTVDIEESARLAGEVVSAGVDALLINGTFGECAALTWGELQAFTRAVLDAVRHRVPVFAGATTLNTRDSIERGRQLMAMGADGLFCGRPMWLPLDQKAIVAFYRDLAAGVPGAPVVVYDNPSAFKGKISAAAFGEISRIPQVVAAKTLGLSTEFLADLRAVGGRLRLLPLDTSWYYLARLSPEAVTACWSGNVACGPTPVLALREAIRAGDWTGAGRITAEMEEALEPIHAGGHERFMRYSIQVDRAKFAAAGYCRPGPARPPYAEAPEEDLANAREAGRRWAVLQSRHQRPADVVVS